jgi:hypothetical protein
MDKMKLRLEPIANHLKVKSGIRIVREKVDLGKGSASAAAALLKRSNSAASSSERLTACTQF